MDKRLAESTLHLTGTYDRRALRKAYAREARKWHPDLQPTENARFSATKHMARINESYSYLKSLFDAGAKTLTASSGTGSAYAPRSGYSVYSGSSGARRGSAGPRTTYGARGSTGAPPRPPVAVRNEPAGAPVAPEPAPEPDPPFRHCLAFRLVEHFPWRVFFLAVVLLLFISPAHAGLDYLTHFGSFQFVLLYQGGFLDFLLWQCLLVPLAIWNLFTGTITNLIQLLLLELIAWAERLVHRLRAQSPRSSTLS